MQSQQASQNKNLFLYGMILSMLTWGISWTCGKIISSYGDAYSIGFYRFFITVLSLLPILLLLKEKILIRRSGIPLLITAATFMSIYSYLFLEGLHHGQPGAAGVLVTTLNPIISFIIGLILEKRSPSVREIIGIIAGLIAGAVLLQVWDNWNNVLQPGNLYFVLAAMCWALLSLATSKSSNHGSPLSFSLWVYAIGSMMLLAFANKHDVIGVLVKADSLFWVNMIFSATITTAIATTFFFYATSKIGASQASSFVFLVPLSAAIGAWVFLNETIQTHTIIGGLIGIIAVYLLQKKKN
jgi:drug/metabolite transporter (DMT)-like permease